MGEPARRLATWTDLLETPDDGRVWEVLGGSLEAQPRPRLEHGHTQALLIAELAGPFSRGRGGPGGWWLVIEPDVELEPHEIVAPDIAGWRRERMGTLPEPPVRIRPDWLCEIASPSNRRRDRGHKADLYLRVGVPTTGSSILKSERWRPSRRGLGRGCAWALGAMATRPASPRCPDRRPTSASACPGSPVAS